MTRLKSRIIELIATLGPIPVNEYMALCLSDPRDGYYTTRDPFGTGGDFITAPEISQMFGELIGAWLAGTWRALGEPPNAIVAEVGPGRGTLIRDIARTLASVEPGLANDYHLVETSAKLTSAQVSGLQGSPGRYEWHTDVTDLPARPLFIVANELFDAIPMRQYVKTTSGWRERHVALNEAGSDLIFAAGAGSVDTSLLPPGSAQAKDGSVVEISPARSAMMQKIAEHLAMHGGAGLFIDYGYLQPGVGDTLQALLKHAYDDPLAHPGEADITSHVDFAALAAVARQTGLETRYITQGEFLLRMGLLERAGQLGGAQNEATRERISNDVERLAAPEAMGTLFKVMAVFPPGANLPPF